MGLFDSILNSALDALDVVTDAAKDVAGDAGNFISDKLLDSYIDKQEEYNDNLDYSGVSELPGWEFSLPKNPAVVTLKESDIEAAGSNTHLAMWGDSELNDKAVYKIFEDTVFDYGDPIAFFDTSVHQNSVDGLLFMDKGLYWNINADTLVFIPWAEFALMPLFMKKTKEHSCFAMVMEDGTLLRYESDDDDDDYVQDLYKILVKLQAKCPDFAERRSQYFEAVYQKGVELFKNKCFEKDNYRVRGLYLQFIYPLAADARQKSLSERLKINYIQRLIKLRVADEALELIETVGTWYAPLLPLRDVLRTYAQLAATPKLKVDTDAALSSPLLEAIKKKDDNAMRAHYLDTDCFGMTMPLYHALFKGSGFVGCIGYYEKNTKDGTNILGLTYQDLAGLTTDREKFDGVMEDSRKCYRYCEERDEAEEKYEDAKDSIREENDEHRELNRKYGVDALSEMHNIDANRRADRTIEKYWNDYVDADNKIKSICDRAWKQAQKKRGAILDMKFPISKLPNDEAIAQTNTAIAALRKSVPPVSLDAAVTGKEGTYQQTIDLTGTEEGERILTQERERIRKKFEFRAKDEFETTAMYNAARQQTETEYVETKLKKLLASKKSPLKVTRLCTIKDDDASALVAAYTEWGGQLTAVQERYQRLEKELEPYFDEIRHAQFWRTMIEAAVTPKASISAYNADKEMFTLTFLLVSKFDGSCLYTRKAVTVPLADAKDFKLQVLMSAHHPRKKPLSDPKDLKQVRKEDGCKLSYQVNAPTLRELTITAAMDVTVNDKPYHFEFTDFKYSERPLVVAGPLKKTAQ
ncbi:hypothetical protein [Gemmiger sp.]